MSTNVVQRMECLASTAKDNVFLQNLEAVLAGRLGQMSLVNDYLTF